MPRKWTSRFNRSATTKLGRSADEIAGCIKNPIVRDMAHRRCSGACKMRSPYSVDDLILNYDPELPAERFRQSGLPAAMKSSTGRLPAPVPWPQGHAPIAAPLPRPPPEERQFRRVSWFRCWGRDMDGCG